MGSEFLTLAAKYPPRIVANHQLSDISKDELDSINLNVACLCGTEKHFVEGIADVDLGLLCPISTNCPACHTENTIFDVNVHGYDGEFGHVSSYPEFEGKRDRLTCKQCDCKLFKVTIRLSYQFEDMTGFDDIPVDEIPNYFDTFGMVLECSECTTEIHIGDYECA